MIRLALSLSSVNTAGSSKIQSHPKSSLSGVTVVAAPKGASTLGYRSQPRTEVYPHWGDGRNRAQRFIHAGVTVVAALIGSSTLE